MDVGALQTLLLAREDDRLEFKEAKNRFDFEELVKYCCALANDTLGRTRGVRYYPGPEPS